MTSVSKAEWAIHELKMPINDNTFFAAVAGGILGVVKLMWNRSEGKITWDKHVCISAAENGHLDVLQWARAQDPPCPWDEWACMYAGQNGHLDVLQWARSQGAPEAPEVAEDELIWGDY